MIGSYLGAIAMAAAVAATPVQPVPDTWAGFSNHPDPKVKAMAAAIDKAKWWENCMQWGRLYRSHGDALREAALLAYLTETGILNNRDRGAAGDRSVALGMTACGVFASQGKPDKLNQTTSTRGNTAQFVYRAAGLYIYTEAVPSAPHGIVKSIQH